MSMTHFSLGYGLILYLYLKVQSIWHCSKRKVWIIKQQKINPLLGRIWDYQELKQIVTDMELKCKAEHGMINGKITNPDHS
jgi:hypothetical protein